MYRTAIEDLKAWKSRANKKPLILEGARQVGKTWLVRKFGEENYANVAYVNLEQDDQARAIFDGSYEPSRIISRLEIHLGMDITHSSTLIIIDEAQENPRVLTSLKYFYEDAPEYNIIVAGSLLGISLHEGVSFPVGKVEFLKIYPLSFEEFLIAIGKERLATALKEQNFELLLPFHDTLIDLYKNYIVVGGMPEVVQAYVNENSLLSVRKIQDDIIKDYERDFSKHADKHDTPKILEIFNVIPAALSKENKKFMFGMIKQSARAREYESALLWLTDAGIATRVNRVNNIALPLSAYEDMNAFKLFMVDIGLLGCKAGLRPETIYDEKAFTEFKGAMAEQFVFQELRCKEKDIFYYSADDSRAEIDFIIDTKNGPLPIEVKSGKSLSSPSLDKILDKTPALSAVKISTLPYKDNGKIINLPIYATSVLTSVLQP